MPEYSFHYDPPKLRISDSEIVVQKTCLRSIAVCFRQTRVVAVPNGGKRTRWAAQRAKAEGLSAGFPDLIVVSPGSEATNWEGLVAFPEIKAGSPLTPEQREWLETLHGMGHYCGVFRSDQTLVDKLKQWGFV